MSGTLIQVLSYCFFRGPLLTIAILWPMSQKGNILPPVALIKQAEREQFIYGPRLEAAKMLVLDGVTGPVVFSPDGTRLTSGDAITQTLKLWDMNDGSLALTIQGGNVGGFMSAAFSSDSGTILTG